MEHSLFTAQLTSLWKKVPQPQLARLLLIVLLLYITYSLAQITWLFLPDAKQNSVTTRNIIASQNSASTNTVKLDEIMKLNLFGAYNQKQVDAKPVKKIESAPMTRLKLVLTGLVASNEPSTAAAIIESKGKQETYGIDDKIEGTRAVLKQVQIDRVIIESSGRMETLMLDGFEYTQQAPEQPKATKKTSKRLTMPKSGKMSALKDRVSELRSTIAKDPTKLTDIIKISPYRVDGKIKGYRLMPNKDPEFFKELGLIPGDVAVQINGSDLTDMRQAQQALKELRTAEHVSLMVERDGALMDVSLGLK